MEAPPLVWTTLLTALGAAPRLARDLWRLYATTDPAGSQTRRYTADQLATTHPALGAWEQRYTAVAATLTPRLLFALTTRLSPEGHRRRRDIVQLEARILAATRAGTWGSVGQGSAAGRQEAEHRGPLTL